jgi:prepilin signal peptidase PulO-like enzyme (type II secretory pathway)
MSFTPPLFFWISVGAAAIISAVLIVPLARRLPLMVEQRWRAEADSDRQSLASPLDPACFQLSTTEKVLTIATGALLGVTVAWGREPTVETAAFGFFFLNLLLLSVINIKHEILPDVIVLPVLWIGLLHHAWLGNAADAVFGAAVGYLVPRLLNGVVRASSRKDVMGYGDMKALAMAGAWFGWQAMGNIGLLFMGILVVLAVGIGFSKVRTIALPTGPAHLLASLGYLLGVRLV